MYTHTYVCRSRSSAADDQFIPLKLKANNAPAHGALKLTHAALPVWGPTCYEFVRHRPPDHAVALRQGIGNEGSFVAFGRLLIGSERLMIEGLICDGRFNPIAIGLPIGKPSGC